jgi:hypothetical protein
MINSHPLGIGSRLVQKQRLLEQQSVSNKELLYYLGQ